MRHIPVLDKSVAGYEAAAHPHQRFSIRALHSKLLHPVKSFFIQAADHHKPYGLVPFLPLHSFRFQTFQVILQIHQRIPLEIIMDQFQVYFALSFRLNIR